MSDGGKLIYGILGFYLTLEDCKFWILHEVPPAKKCFYLTLEDCKSIQLPVPSEKLKQFLFNLGGL